MYLRVDDVGTVGFVVFGTSPVAREAYAQVLQAASQRSLPGVFMPSLLSQRKAVVMPERIVAIVASELSAQSRPNLHLVPGVSLTMGEDPYWSTLQLAMEDQGAVWREHHEDVFVTRWVERALRL